MHLVDQIHMMVASLTVFHDWNQILFVQNESLMVRVSTLEIVQNIRIQFIDQLLGILYKLVFRFKFLVKIQTLSLIQF